MKDKKIFYLRTDLGTQNLTAGGSVAHTLGVINGFLAHGYHMHIASSAMIGMLQKLPNIQFKPLHMPAVTAWVGFKFQCLFSNIFFFFCTWRLCNASTEFIYQRYSLLNCTGVLLSWWHKIPLVLEFNGSEVWADEHWAKNKMLRMRWLVAWFERVNIRNAHTIVVVSEPLKDFLMLQGVAVEKILVNPNGVDADLYDPALLHEDRIEIRKRLNLDNNFVFGFIGTFSYWHGINVLERMIPEVLRRCPTVKFMLIGSGPFLQQLKDSVAREGISADRVLFMGMIDQHLARSYLAACDAFLSPTQPNSDSTPFFGSPTKLFEYMSLGKPIIASDLGTLAAILKPNGSNQFGILVAPLDIEGFIESACALAMQWSQQELKLLGNNAREEVLKKYTWHQHVAKIVMYTELSHN